MSVAVKLNVLVAFPGKYTRPVIGLNAIGDAPCPCTGATVTPLVDV